MPETRNRTSANGEGSCRYIESKKLWCVRVTVGWEQTETGNKQIRKAFYGKRKRDALDKATAAQARVLRGEAATSSNIKISTWADKWFEVYASALSPRTVDNYREVLKNQVKAYLGDLTLKSLKASDIMGMLTDLAKKGKSKSLVSRAKILTNAMLEAAVDDDLLIKNPCRKIKLPAMQGSKEKEPFTAEEKEGIYSFIPHYLTLSKPHHPHRVGYMIEILLKTGMRQEELLALQWKHINFKKNQIQIRQAVSLKDGSPVIKDPKSFKSKRDIPMREDVATIFSKFMPDDGNMQEQYIFPTKSGGLWLPRNFQRDYKMFFEAAQKAGRSITYKSPHTCRHTFASDLRAKGVDAKTISKLLGHSKVNISYDVYIHTDAKSERDAVEKL